MIKKIVRKLLKRIKRKPLAKGEHTLQIKGGQIEYYVHSDISRGSVVPVFFHAAIDRKKIQLPRYEGIGLCKKNNWKGISFADPVLPLDDNCSLAWFVGNDRYPMLQKEIHRFLSKIARKYRLTFVFHGGSGGGYAALVQKSFFGNKHFAIVQNPQTNIFYLSKQHTINYFNTYDNVPLECDYEEILQKNHLIYKVCSKQVRNVLYFQNQSDELHVNMHLRPFLGEQYETEERYLVQRKRNNYYFVGNWGTGHAVLPGEVLEKIIQLIVKEQSLEKIETLLVAIADLQLLDGEQCVNLLR